MVNYCKAKEQLVYYLFQYDSIIFRHIPSYSIYYSDIPSQWNSYQWFHGFSMDFPWIPSQLETSATSMATRSPDRCPIGASTVAFGRWIAPAFSVFRYAGRDRRGVQRYPGGQKQLWLYIYTINIFIYTHNIIYIYIHTIFWYLYIYMVYIPKLHIAWVMWNYDELLAHLTFVCLCDHWQTVNQSVNPSFWYCCHHWQPVSQ